MSRESCHAHNRNYLTTGKNEVILLAEKWMQLEIINLIKANYISLRQKACFSSFVGPRFSIETYYMKLEVNRPGEQARRTNRTGEKRQGWVYSA